MNNNSSMDGSDSQAMLNKLMIEHLREQKRKRFWRWIMRALILFVILLIVYKLLSASHEGLPSHSKPHVGLIDVQGTISASDEASADNLSKGMDKAYENKSMKALILRVDSPGGSPVQADYMFNTIRYYHGKYPAIKIYAVCVDACASAAYYLAAAADEIYANPSSLVGSIGVLYNGFGFVDTMQKVGVSRRLHISGRNKGFMDPFSPENPEQEKMMQTMLDIIHEQFIDRVKEGRGSRLLIDDETFSGLFWTGTQAKSRGLIDGFASSGQLARDIIKIDKIVEYTHKESVFDRVAKTIGTAMANQLPTALGMKPGVQ